MRHCHMPVLLIAIVIAARSVDTNGQGRAGGTVDVATLPYKLIEFPTPATSAAGFPAPWNLIQVSAVAISAKGNVLVLHRGAHPILKSIRAGGSSARGATGCSVKERSQPFRNPTGRRTGRATRRCMALPDARRAALIRCESILRATSGW